MKRTFSLLMITLLSISVLTLAFDVQTTMSLSNPAPAELTSSLVLEFNFPPPVVTEGNVYDSVTMSGLPQYGAPGEPILPFKLVKALIPQGKSVQSVGVSIRNSMVLKGRFDVEYGRTCMPVSSNATVEDRPDEKIYGSTDPFPGFLFSEMSEQHLRGYEILVLKLHPVQYIPKTGELLYSEAMTVNMSLRESGRISQLFRSSPQDRGDVLGVVDNLDEVNTYINTVTYVQRTSIVNSSYSYDYVIITNNVLKSSFQPLIDWKIQKGLNATIVLVEDIMKDPDYNWGGLFGDGLGSLKFNDTQAHIRNFIKDAYQNWGTEYILLGGDDEIIPSRGVYVYAGDYTDYNIPCDMYYGTLDGSWDNDNDTIFGEAVLDWSGPENGTAGDEADFFAEVYVGRATVDNAEEATIFVNKTLAYEQAPNASYLKRALMIGEKLDSITEGGNGKDLVTEIIPQYTTTRLYDRDGTFSRTSVIDEMNGGVQIVNHDGHADYGYVMGLYNSDVDGLTNTEYFLAYSLGCYSAAFDEATSGASEAIAEHFITSNGGAFAYIGNSRYGWYIPGGTEGPGDLCDRSFFSVLINGTRNLGKALQLSKEEVSWIDRWTCFTLNLLGDPETEVVTAIRAPTAHFQTRTNLLTPPRIGGLVTLQGTARRGTATGATFNYFTIEFGYGTNPTSWMSTGMNLIDNGLNEVINGTLATWDTSQIAAGTYTLKLNVFDADGLIGEDRWVVLVPIYDIYTRTYLPNEWIGGGTPMSWHADDASWTYPLPFNFPFYGNNYSSIYISSNGLITFLNPDSSYGSSISALAGKLAIAPAWDDWVTYDPYDIYMWQGSNRVSIRWYVRAYGSSTEANFEAILTADGEIQFNYQYNDGPVSTTIGISNGVGDILAEDATTLSYINTIKFIPWSLALSVHNINSGLDYSTIQGAIDAQETSDGHTIFAETGTYYENVVVNKAIALVGEDHETTIIDGNYMGTVIRVTADDVTIMNFTVRNSGVFPDIGIKIENSNTTISGNIVTSNCIGIYIHPGLDHNKITGNTVKNSGHSGISLEASSYNLISGNHIEDSYYYGIFLGWSSNFNDVSENEITNNGLGIYLCYSSPTFNRIIDNNITNNDRGISLFDASNNTVSGNNIANNTFGFFLAGRLTGSLNNCIYHNNIANNTHQVHDESWVDPEQFPSINVWDDGYPSGGNYWSDYVGVDLYNGPYQNETGSDKIGDTPYYVPTGSQDRYPLMNPYTNTTVSLEPVQMSVSFGQIFAVDVHVSNVVDLYAYEFKLTWNYSVVELQSAVRPSGHFLEPQIDPGNQFVPVWKINESRSGDLQTAHFGYTLLAPEQAKTGSGILVTLTFRALAVGSTLLDLKNTMLTNDVSAPIMHSHLDSLVTVNPPPSVAISPDSVVMDVGQSQLFTSSVSGGASPFAYQWFLNDAPVSGATSATWTFVPSSAAFFMVYLKVTDNVGVQVTSNGAAVTVNNALSVSISPTSVTLNIGQSQLFASTVSGGTSPFGYQWCLNGVAVSGATSATWAFTPNSTGFYNVYVNVTDGVSFVAKSNSATVTVNPPVSVTISPTSVVMTVGQSQLFTSSVANGTPPYTYQWHLDDTPVSGATSPTWAFAPTTNGTYHVYLRVTDSVSGTAQSNAVLVTVVSGVHDIALTGITNSKSGCRPFPTIGQNDTCQINITVSNLGDYSESFNVTVYVNSTEIQRIAVINLAPLTARVLTVNWSTIGFAKGNYTISALAEPVIGETNTANNSVIGETVVVVMQGDINADKKVNIIDIVRVALAFGAVPANPNWDPNADINGDKVINIIDIAIVALHFGETG